MVFVGFIFLYFSFSYKLCTRIYEDHHLLFTFFLKTFEGVRCETLHAKAWENKFKSFSWKSLGEDVGQLKIRLHEVEFHNPLFHLFPYEVMTDVDVFGP